MSSKGYATPLRLEIVVNPLLRRLYLGMSLCAVVVLLFLPLPVMANLSAVFLLLLCVRYVWRRRAELGGAAVKLVWDGEQRWWWTSDGREERVELQDDSYIVPRLAVLNFRVAGSRGSRAVVLTPEAIGREVFRLMQVRFRITPKDSSPA